MEQTYTLRSLKDGDAPRMLEWMQDERVTAYLQIGGKNTTMESVRRFIAAAQKDGENLHRAIVDEQDVYHGTVSLKHIDHEKGEAEYAIAMHMDSMGTGAAKQGSEQILALAAREQKLKRLYLYVRRDNARAVRFYEKMGWARFEHGEGDNGLFWYEKRFV